MQENEYEMIIVNARFFKPIDEHLLTSLLNLNLPIYVFETDVTMGGLSSAILEFQNQYKNKIHILGISDHFVEHGSIRALRKKEHIDLESLFKEIDAHE